MPTKSKNAGVPRLLSRYGANAALGFGADDVRHARLL
jgi:hypothetical protein